jgi:hypothetical protein
VWHWLCSAGNSLADNIEDLRADGYERWESGDEASIELFSENGIPQAKVFTQRAIHDLTRLGRSWRVRSASGDIDTERFDPKEVPRLVELQATIEDVRKEDIKEEDDKIEVIKREHIKKEDVQNKVIKKEDVESSPQGPVLSSIERKPVPPHSKCQH